MKYKINAEIKKNKYCLEIGAIWETQQKSGIQQRFRLATAYQVSILNGKCFQMLCEVKLLLRNALYYPKVFIICWAVMALLCLEKNQYPYVMLPYPSLMHGYAQYYGFYWMYNTRK